MQAVFVKLRERDAATSIQNAEGRLDLALAHLNGNCFRQSRADIRKALTRMRLEGWSASLWSVAAASVVSQWSLDG